MSENLTALASENLNPSLRSLLEDVQRGYIRVPRFQRPFIWTDEQRLQLLQSLRDNMPIGSILLWRTSKYSLSCFPEIGPHLIPTVEGSRPTTGWQYLLDGHQRVSTLLGLLLQSGSKSLDKENDSIDWDIQYDLEIQDFVFAQRRKYKANRVLLPLWTLFDGRMVNRKMREIRRDCGTSRTDDELDVLEERADQLSYRFQQCRIPVVVMASDDLELAAKTFQRVNSLGTPMGETHLVTALTWRSDFDLRERLEQMRSSLPAGWRHMNENLFLQVCKGLCGLDMTKAGHEELVKQIRTDETLLHRAQKGMSRAINWLITQVGVVHYDLLPYGFQLTLLAVALNDYPLDHTANITIAAWFWRTSWSEIFGYASYRQVTLEQKNLAKAFESRIPLNEVWSRDRGLPNRFDSRSARVKLLMLRMAARRGAADLKGNPVLVSDMFSAFGRDGLARLISPNSSESKTASALLLQSAGNRFVLSPNLLAEFRDDLIGRSVLDKGALDYHFLTDEDVMNLRAGQISVALEARQQRLQEWDLKEWEFEQNRASNREH